MVIDLTNNTRLIGDFDSQQPQAALRAMVRRGLAGLADAEYAIMPYEGSPSMFPSMPTKTDIATATAAANAEGVFWTNLVRQAQGMPPIDPRTSAPTVNVGLDADTKNLLLMGGIGALALMLLKR